MASTRNVRARILLTREAPALPRLEAPLTVWWLDDRFHAREESGRSFTEVAADASDPRGLGHLPRTVEGLMDAHIKLAGRLDVYGSLSTEQALVVEPRGARWKTDTRRASPIAGQLFPHGLDGLKPSGKGTVLGRECTEYTTPIEVRDGGLVLRSTARYLVAGGLVLRRDVADGSGLVKLRAEVTALDEGVVRDADVTP